MHIIHLSQRLRQLENVILLYVHQYKLSLSSAIDKVFTVMRESYDNFCAAEKRLQEA